MTLKTNIDCFKYQVDLNMNYSKSLPQMYHVIRDFSNSIRVISNQLEAIRAEIK